MAQLGSNHVVNPNELEESYDILPAGEYKALIESSDILPTKAGDGMIKIVYVILEGEFKGRKVYENINYFHPKPDVRAMAIKTMNSIGVACGLSTIQDTAQLHGTPMIIDVHVKAPSGNYGATNSIKKHLPLTAGAVANAPAGVTTAGVVPNKDINPATGKPYQAWEKRP